MQRQKKQGFTVNFHFGTACNMHCRYCFVEQTGNCLNSAYLKVAEKLAGFFSRVNFVGGEPTVSPLLVPLVRKAESVGMECTMVTNGFELVRHLDKFNELLPMLSCIGVSIDSLNEKTNREIGRSKGKQIITREEYVELCSRIKAQGIRLKINTVVNRLNVGEDFSDFYKQVNPDRIKMFQVAKPAGKLKHEYDDLLISGDEFDRFVNRHRCAGFDIVAEDNDAMANAYFILDSECCFFDNKTGAKSPSLARNDISVEEALSFIKVDLDKYDARYSV